MGELNATALCRRLTYRTLRFLGDAVTPRTRAAAYRLLRYVLDRQSWGIMLESGIEWLFIRYVT
jgi:hypothetical protein